MAQRVNKAREASITPMTNELGVSQKIVTAIDNGLRLEVSYNGHKRVIEPHALGITSLNNAVIRCYQVSGDSDTGKSEGWKMLKVAELRNVTVLKEKSLAPRAGYKLDDNGMIEIFHQYPTEP